MAPFLLTLIDPEPARTAPGLALALAAALAVLAVAG